MSKYSEICISGNETISNALKQMDKVKRKLLIVTEKPGYYNKLISIGDIQRAIINGKDIMTPIHLVLRDEVMVAYATDNINSIKEHMRLRRNDFMPVIDDNNKIVNVIFWEDLFGDKKELQQFDLPIVIMAGGKGIRMRPLTNVIPKPLIPINEKTIIENIMDRFLNHGSKNFYLSVNYKANLIEYYFKNLKSNSYNISYFHEDKPLGTAGSLTLLKDQIHTTFFVSNCDILIEQDYHEILNYHYENQNELTIVAAIKQLSVPYGTLETGERGLLKSLVEKPTFNFKINSGMYIVEPHLLDEIPKGTFFHITELIERILKRNGKVGVFPVSEASWKDIGEWNEYLNALKND